MTWECLICNWRYEPQEGIPAAGIAAGTSFEALPHEWTCPDCGAAKEDFFAVEENA